MASTQYNRKIRFQEELDHNFLKEVSENSGCYQIDQCIQCGACSGSCPLSIYMDPPPRRIIGMVKNGFREDALKSLTIWLCASCYACNVSCPQGIRITDVMYSLKRTAMREKLYPKKFPMPVLSREFFNMVLKSGRNSEFRLILQVWLKVSVFKLFGMAPLGWDLLKRRRIYLKKESIRNKKELNLILNSLDET